MAAPTYRASGSGGTATTTSTTIAKPAGTTAGDAMYALVVNGGAPAAPSTVPTGWALTVGLAIGAGGWVGVYEHIAGASEPASYLWDGFTDSCAGSMVAISGADTTTPTHQAAATATLNSGAPSCPGVTTTEPDCLILGGVGVGDNVGASGWAATNPALLTERVEVQSTGGADTTSALATAPQTSTGATGALTVTLAGSRNSVVVVIAVRPPQAAGGDQTVSPSAIGSGEAHGTPALALGVTPSGIATGEAHGGPAITTGLTPAGIASGEAFGVPTLAQDGAVAPGSIGSGEAHGQPAITTGLAAAGIASAEAVGTPALTRAGTIAPAGIASAEAHGTPLLTQHVAAAGVATGEQLGTPNVALGLGGGPEIPGEDVPDAGGIASTEAHGKPSLTLSIAMTGITSREVFGVPAIAADVLVLPMGITSSEAFGVSVLRDADQGQDLSPLGGTLEPSGALGGALTAVEISGSLEG